MTQRYGEHDHEHYERPRRRTRPRTKERPAHADAVSGRVVTVDRGRYTVLVESDAVDRTVTAMRARQLGRKAVVVGDVVQMVGDVTGDTGSLSRIVRVEPRRTVLRRTADDDDPVERVIVANAEQLVVVTSLADPPPRPRLIDRCLVAAYDAGMQPVICLTKSDLGSSAELIADYEPLGVPMLVTGRDSDLDEVRARLRDRVSVLVGHSGVGKSTLVNALVPDAYRLTSHVNEATGRGRHTSSSAIVLALPFGGLIVDTPGIRSFGLAHVDPSSVLASFTDLAEAAASCPRGCMHAAGELECALDTAVADGRLDARRVASMRRVLSSREPHGGE
ncbi:MAG: ribosome small subunit-dependent GTPase A [Nocardioidaceae bacterium]|nr:ribosome small subunit-dependent GTPase A [Nocardioidaceae bacterium]